MAGKPHSGGVLYVPTRPRDPSTKQLVVEVYTLADGRRALRGYTSVETLKRCCGEYQQWAAFDQAGLVKVKGATGYDVVCLDVPMPTHAPPPRRRDHDDLSDVDFNSHVRFTEPAYETYRPTTRRFVGDRWRNR